MIGRAVYPAGRLLLAALLVAAAPDSRAADQTADAVSPSHAAFSGFWHSALPITQPFTPTPPDVLAKMQPWVAAQHAKDLAAQAAGKFLADPTTTCMPAFVPGAGVPGGGAYGIDILVEPRQVTFLYEAGRGMRFVYLGQKQPTKLEPSWMGHSVGHWEGDVLVVDTRGFNEKNEVPVGVNLAARQSDSLRMTSQMHIVERYRMMPNGQLEDQATFDDPGAFTAPFTLTYAYRRAEPFQEYICQENNLEGGYPTARGPAKPTNFLKPGAAATEKP